MVFAGESAVVEGLEDAAHVGVDVRDHRVDSGDRVGLGRESPAGSAGRAGETRRVSSSSTCRWTSSGSGASSGSCGQLKARYAKNGRSPSALTKSIAASSEDVAAITLVTLGLAVVLQDRVEVAAAAGRVGRLADAAALDHERLLKALVDRPQRVRCHPGATCRRCPVRYPAAARISASVTSSGCISRSAQVGVHHARAEVVPAGEQAGARRRQTGET